MRPTHNLIALTALITPLITGLAGCRGGESKLPPVHLVLNMDTQEKGKAYREDTSGIFADGRVMRTPVVGTVAQGNLGEDRRYEDGLDDAGDPTLAFPDAAKANGSPIDPTLVARGKARYGIYCSPCHGVALDGKGVMTEPSLDGSPRLVVPPPSFHTDRLKNMPAGQIYGAIKNGVNQGNMGSYAAQIPLPDRWAIVSFIRSEQKAKDATVDPEGGKIIKLVAADTPSVDFGAQVYAAKGCVACHSTDGNRLVGPSFKGLWGRPEQTNAGEVTVDAAYVRESITAPGAKVVTGYPPAMPQLAFTAIELESLVLFIESLK